MGSPVIEGAPSAFAYSRFMRKLQKGKYVVMVKNILRSLTRECYATFPNFGKSTALDSTDLKAWSNGRRNPPTDPDAGWVVKLDTAGRRKYVWGYRLHVLADTTYELPIAVSLSAGNVNDVRYAPRVLVEARVTTQKFHPDYIACDAGYSSDRFRTLIRRQYSAMPVVKANPVHKKAVARGESEEFKRAYGTRTSVERLFGRLKGHRRLNNITVRRKRRVAVHCLVPLIVTQAQALVHPDRPRACVR